MQLALLVQVHDMLQSAAITAIGPVHQIIELKSNSEIELNDIIQRGIRIRIRMMIRIHTTIILMMITYDWSSRIGT